MEDSIEKQLELLNQQAKELSAIYHAAAGKFGISDGEFWVWYALLVLPGEHSQQSICDTWSLPRQTVNSIVSNMVKKEFVHLEAIPGTRNRKVIRLTAAGKAYGESVVKKVHEAELRTMRQMTEQERQLCTDLFGKYIPLLRAEFNKT